MAYLEVEGSSAIYYEHFSGSGMPVVLIHGWAMSARIWDGVVSALLADGHPVVRLDQRCCGRSDKTFADVSIDALGSDIARLVDHLDLDRVVVNGWSLGGAVAVDAVAKFGGTAAGLVLTCGASPRFTRSDDWEFGGTGADLATNLAALSTMRVDFMHGMSQAVCNVEVSTATIDWMTQIFLETSPRADASLQGLGRIDQRELMAKIEVPALVMHGAHDVFVPVGAGARASEILPRARLVQFADSGHAPFLEEREKYCRELLGFLADLS